MTRSFMHQSGSSAAWFFLSLGLLVCSGWCQGGGVTGSNGVEPEIHLDKWQVSVPNVLSISGLVPQAAPSLWLVVSPAPGELSLAGMGAPGAVVGVDLAQSLVLGPYQASGTGTWMWNFQLPGSFLGATLWAQALNEDPAAPHGFALSDALALTFGGSDDRIIGARGTQSTDQQLTMIWAGGTAGPLAPALGEMELLQPALSAARESFGLRTDIPALDVADPLRPRILLPTGGALYHYRDAQDRYGWFLVHDRGRRFVPILREQGSAATNPFESTVAVSPFEPIGAVIVEDVGLAQDTRVILFRTDGDNWAGCPAPWVEVTGLPLAYDPKGESMTFLSDVLLLSDGSQVVRLGTDLATAPEVLVLPSSGGLTPIEVDREFAWASDGTTAAFSAGQSDVLRDIYVVGSSGAPTNITQLAAEYEAVSHGDFVDGARIALSPDGSAIAYIRDVAGSPEVFVQDSVASAPLYHVTNNALFANTIEQEAGLNMFDPRKLVLNAGAGILDHDIYGIQLPQTPTGPTLSQNLTGTSGIFLPPYGTGSQLSATGRGSVDAQTLVTIMSDQGTGFLRVAHVTSAGTSSLVGDYSQLTAFPGTKPTLIGMGPQGSDLLALEPGGITVLLSVPGSDHLPLVAHEDVLGTSLLVWSQAATTQLVIRDGVGNTTLVGSFSGATGATAGHLADGRYIVPTEEGGNFGFRVVDPLSMSTSSQLGSGAPLRLY